MEITEVRVSPRNEERLKAYVTITFDDAFVVRHVRIVKTEKGLLVSMPSRKLPDGSHKDIAHPITQEFRKKLETKILAAYEEELKKGPPNDSEKSPVTEKTFPTP
ncbi:MAG: septation protein SpoVG family protein [Elusimicrobia bacterium]|nr:septation protein SpoVG family protein [Elusimicrobiota bacterium]MBI3013144.1 septation protein SpoVG family protein [Elusimicrobiota bacterium]